MLLYFREDIDIIDSSNLNRFAENFNLTLNINVNEHRCSDVKCAWDSNQNEKPTRQLLFTTSEEYLQCQEDFGTCFHTSIYPPLSKFHFIIPVSVYIQTPLLFYIVDTYCNCGL